MTSKEVFSQLLEKDEYKIKPPGDYVKRIQKLLDTCIKTIKQEDYTYPPHYRNNKGEIKQIDISRHALARFIKRFKVVYKGDISDLSNDKFRQLLCFMINSSEKENLHNKTLLKSRKQKHANTVTSMYIAYGCFRFVICGMNLVTSELKGYYHNLN